MPLHRSRRRARLTAWGAGALLVAGTTAPAASVAAAPNGGDAAASRVATRARTPVLPTSTVLLIDGHRVASTTNLTRNYLSGTKIRLDGLQPGQVDVTPVTTYLGQDDAKDGDVDVDSSSIFGVGSVIEERVGGAPLFRMWLRSGTNVGYRESADGLHWHIHDPDSVIVATGVSGASVLRDYTTGLYYLIGFSPQKKRYVELVSVNGISFKPSTHFAGVLSRLPGDVVEANADPVTGALVAVAKEGFDAGQSCGRRPALRGGGRAFGTFVSTTPASSDYVADPPPVDPPPVDPPPVVPPPTVAPPPVDPPPVDPPPTVAPPPVDPPPVDPPPTVAPPPVAAPSAGRTLVGPSAARTWLRPGRRLMSDCVDARSFPATSGTPRPVEQYGLSFQRYGDQFIGFPWLLHITVAAPPGRSGLADGPIDTQIASTPDVVRVPWTRSDSVVTRAGRHLRPALIPRGPDGAWDDGMLFGQANLLSDGQHSTVYYTGWDGLHRPVLGRSARVGAARWRLDRFVGRKVVDPRAFGYLRTTAFVLPARAAARDLVVNAALAHGRFLRVGVVDARTGRQVPGFGLTDSTVLRGDNLAATVRWRGQWLGDLRSRPLSLLFRYGAGSLYSFAVR